MLLDMLSVISALINLFGCTLKMSYIFFRSSCGYAYDGGDSCAKTVQGGEVKKKYWFVTSGRKTVAIVSSYLCLFI